MNPFKDEYAEQEVKFYNLSNPYDKDGIKVVITPIKGRCDDYLNRNMRFCTFPIPILTIDGTVWMSLSFMEVQSSYLAIQRAKGYVGTAGLGLGYFTLRAAAKPDVISIDVYEQDQRIIDFFLNTFSDREGVAEKVSIIQGDAREIMYDKRYDFCFVDIYDQLLPEEIYEDILHFQYANDINIYQFWGQERVLVDAIYQGETPDLMDDETKYIEMWTNATFKIGEQTHRYRDLYREIRDLEYNTQILEALNRL